MSANANPPADDAAGRPARGAVASPWAPLQRSLFRTIWIAAFVSNVGTFMHNVGAAWLMTSLTDSPTFVALIQTALNLPFFFLALPAGALADLVDRRRLLLLTQSFMLAAAGALAVMTHLRVVSPWALLALTLVLGIGTALNGPAWQAIMPELVPPADLGSAIALNSAGFNLARVIGPTVGGLVVAASGPAATFFLNAASFVGVVVVLFSWRRPPTLRALPPERVVEAIATGLRYARHSRAMRAVLVRTAVFTVFASALWALLPVLARRGLDLGAGGYGALLGFFGGGAILAAVVLPRLKRHLGLDPLLLAATALFGGAAAVAAFVPSFPAVAAAMVGAGAAWLTSLSTFNTRVQAAVPQWVRGRALALYQLVAFGGLSAGSAVWGAVADAVSLAAALGAAAVGMVLALALAARFRLGGDELLDVVPSRHWPDPAAVGDIRPDDGPVLVTVEYRIEPGRWGEFAAAMGEIRRIRLRDGALRWNLLRDVSDPGRVVELFVVESWLEHLRQHERVTVVDRECEERARSFQLGPEPPSVSHFIAEPVRDEAGDSGIL